jgi:serine O-acetyltransferase
MVHDLERSIQELYKARGGTFNLPPKQLVPTFVQEVLAILFPHFAEVQVVTMEQLRTAVQRVGKLLEDLCKPVMPDGAAVSELHRDFVSTLPSLMYVMREDAAAIFAGDPAAKSVDEVISAYPGFLAIAVYRLAHWLYERHVPIVPRMITEHAHYLAGVDIHPGATIGRAFVIDHGTGIVIGETTLIEDHVKIYQGVTLGALSVEKSLADSKRHPTIERDVVIYANATILGGETVIGAGSVVGGNVWLTQSVPAGSRVYHRGDVTVTSR